MQYAGRCGYPSHFAARFASEGTKANVQMTVNESDGMSGVAGLCPPPPDVIENIQHWTRRRFKLEMDAPVLVAEVTCTMPLCPPLETAVAFWTQGEKRHQFKLYKPAADVIYDDIGWLMGTPADHEGTLWDCC